MANIYGIDVSQHNGTLDWAKIKASGIKFAIIRTGYGKSYTDPQFHANMKGAIAQGLPIGIYHFTYALNVEGVKKEAAFVLSLLETYRDKITLPVFFDFEYDTISYALKQSVTLGKQEFNDHAVAFCEAVKAAGYIPGVYYNLDYKNRFVDASRLGGYVQWYAQYNSTAAWTGYDLWQYSSNHKISGHSCRFDINVAPESFLQEANTTQPDGWVWDDGDWYYYQDGTMLAAEWVLYKDKWYYLLADGKMQHSTSVEAGGKTYIFDENGACTVIEKDSESAEADTKPGVKEPERMEKRFYMLAEVESEIYRATLDKMIATGVIKGKGGEGEELILDLGEDAIRLLVYLDRAGFLET